MLRKFSFLPIIIFVVGFFWYSIAKLPVNSHSTEKIEIYIEPGTPLDQTIKILYEEKLIRSRVAAKVNILIHGTSKKIQAGYFYFSQSENLPEIVSGLKKANSKQIWITIPEGVRREEIAFLISQEINNNDFETNFSPQDFIKLTANLEGHLFPNTYAFDPKVSTEKVVEKLNEEFEKKIKELDVPVNQKEKITIIASLLERESQNSQEMPLIAGIILKRINSGWPLQIDATVQYAISTNRCRQLSCNWWPSNLTRAELSIESAYNTYLNLGLPPSAISNPGFFSLQAANNPEESSHWFYLHDKEGKIHFADTIEEHNRNICQYLGKSC